jgi:hypothetical protein
MHDMNIVLGRAVRAYERARMRRAVERTLPVAGLLLIAAVLLGGDLARCLVAIGCASAAWVFLWRGRALGRGVWPGLAAGLMPLAASTTMAAMGHSCGVGPECDCSTLCEVVCASGGVGAGLALGFALRRQPGAVAAGAVLAAGVGLIGCVALGLGSAVGMTLGAVGGAIGGTTLARALRLR